MSCTVDEMSCTFYSQYGCKNTVDKVSCTFRRMKWSENVWCQTVVELFYIRIINMFLIAAENLQ